MGRRVDLVRGAGLAGQLVPGIATSDAVPPGANTPSSIGAHLRGGAGEMMRCPADAGAGSPLMVRTIRGVRRIPPLAIAA